MQDNTQKRREIIARLVEARLEKGISQAELARMIGTQRSNLCRLESGAQNPSLDMLLKIADALGKDISMTLTDRKEETGSIYSLRIYDTELVRFSMEKRGLEGLVAEIELSLQNQIDREVSSSQIGELVLERLKQLDEVAYVRFASVYREFKDVDSFMAELKQLAKQKAIPYYNNFSKPQLVQAISDPVKAVEISAQTKARLLSQRAARAANAAAKPPLMPKGTLGASDVFKDMSIVPAHRTGVPVYSDKGMVEGLNLTARRVSVDGSEVYELVGKLTESTWSATWDTLKGQSEVRQFVFEKADDTLALLSSRPINMSGVSMKARVLEDGDSKLELYVHNGARQYNGWKGFFRLRVAATSNGAADAKAAKDMLQRVGLIDLTSTPTTEAESIFRKSRLLWQNAPGRMSELNGLTGKALTDKLDAMLTEEGLTKRVGNLVTQTVFDGYSTVVEQGISKEYSKAGLRYVWAGVNREDAVVSILQGKGLMATNTRCRAGMDLGGASPVDDMESGGSDSVFTRIGVQMKKGPQPRFDNCYMGSGYRIIISPEVMERTDWYAYDHDNYGRTSDLASRPTPLEFIKDMATKYRNGNEIMFRQGIPKEAFSGIVCPSQAHMASLQKKLKAAGITEINGIPIKDFLKVGSEI